jgi:PleD family two-component response regulator
VERCADPGLPTFTTSGGVSEWQAGETIDVSVARADEALYAAKQSGRNRVR